MRLLYPSSEYKEAFDTFDTDENGHMSTKELKQAMRLLGRNPTDAEMQMLINEKDADSRCCSALWVK